MGREKIITLLDNKAMITESMLKNSLIVYTGRVKFRSIKRTNYRGIVGINSGNSTTAFVLSFEVRINDRKEFYDLYTKQNELKEFASLNSVVKYLQKINFFSSEHLYLNGEVYEEKTINEKT